MLVAGIVGLCYLAVTSTTVNQGDFPNHIKRAEALRVGIVQVPHILFHALMAIGLLAGGSSTVVAIGVTVGMQVAAALTALWYIRVTSGAAPWIGAMLAICLLAVGPIVPFDVAADQDLYPAGYFLPNSIHNPTVIAAKPFVPVLLAIGVSASGLSAQARFPIAVAAAFVLLAGIAKPHYVSCLVPAALACAAVRTLRHRRVPWAMTAWGLVAPAAVVIAWTVVGTTELSGGGSTIVAPLAVLRHYAPMDSVSVLQRIMSDIAFPIGVVALWPTARRFPALVVAWSAYGVGLSQAFLLAESGPRLLDGNFIWSPQLATFGLMTASAAFLAQRHMEGRYGWREAAAWLVLLLHVAYGGWWLWGRMDETAE